METIFLKDDLFEAIKELGKDPGKFVNDAVEEKLEELEE